MKIKHLASVEAKCSGCFCTLEIEESDLKEDMSGEIQTPYYAKCMRCGNIIPISRTDIPKSWMNNCH